jgi:hypothetical protein
MVELAQWIGSFDDNCDKDVNNAIREIDHMTLGKVGEGRL